MNPGAKKLSISTLEAAGVSVEGILSRVRAGILKPDDLDESAAVRDVLRRWKEGEFNSMEEALDALHEAQRGEQR